MEKIVAEEGRKGVTCLVKALKILECFTCSRQELSLAQISKLLGIPKTTAYGIISTLKNEGYLDQTDDTRTFRMGTKLLDLGYNAKMSLPIIQLYVPVLDKLRNETQQNIYLTTHRDGRLLYLESCYRDHAYIGYSATGKTLPLHCTASGKAIMSYMTDGQVQAIVRTHGLARVTGNTITDFSMLQKDLLEARNRGFAVDDEEESIGVKCVAVALLNEKGVPVGAVSASGSTMTMKMAKIYEFSNMISQQCRLMSVNADRFPYRFLPSESLPASE